METKIPVVMLAMIYRQETQVWVISFAQQNMICNLTVNHRFPHCVQGERSTQMYDLYSQFCAQSPQLLHHFLDRWTGLGVEREHGGDDFFNFLYFGGISGFLDEGSDVSGLVLEHVLSQRYLIPGVWVNHYNIQKTFVITVLEHMA